MIVVLRDLSVGLGRRGGFLAADPQEWDAGRPDVQAYRGPDAPAELLPAHLLEEVPCRRLLEGPDGFWECDPEEPERYSGLGEASSRTRKSYKKSSFKKKAPHKKKAFKKKAADLPRPSLPELTQAMWALIYPEAFQPLPPGTRLRYQPSEDAPPWIHGMDLDPKSFFDMEEVWTLTRETVRDPGWEEMVSDCREGGDLAMFPIALVADAGGNQALKIARFFKIPESVFKKSRDPDEDVIGPFAMELSEAIEQLKPPGFPGRFDFGYTDASEYGLIYVEC
jgi:hypothetical protein